MHKYLMLCMVMSLGACQSDPQHRQILDEEAVSFAKLDGYEVRHTRGASVLTTDAADKQRSSIVVRRVPYDRRHDRTPESIAVATEESLRALPNAQVQGPIAVDDANYAGLKFDLSFQPKTQKGRIYERRHVVLFGEEHIYHVLQTAPKGRLSATSVDFLKVVRTLREEG